MSQQPDAAIRRSAVKNLLLYGLARLALFILLTALIQIIATMIGALVPIFISAMLALLIAMPLSVFVFKGLRVKATTAVAQWHYQRKAYKKWVQDELASR
ncbi:DUF4229 domain-containing protein [Corynebacterium sp. ES2794-CONJ1]|uniref:DUF4229 domain-containing protein n=1 Tax=unclassified Corynebacterium TaxID=2624378 RepID=UPI00216904D1|nr:MULTISPECIES: DUF4229 domain-containing protein [unclassified Corynebacterium]MCS4489704.1 DUF4229 domain-containing protein [Corynebacterium sp. ES2775-CONJ]MCS4491287.1 DUF4229 domain-containing protein [Corynebacterium sp. ES2715-CONJ3]MCS4531616.1 DUF4229 domain-containing protein [Corynebacterium sp. ES2730-CONJ]MCU9519012.1 DUF4229 domain-containing protein [Corynebacterium sp. ES2794-CONJ1]